MLLGVQRLRRTPNCMHAARSGDLCVCLRQLDPAAPGSHDEDYVYPIGFRTSRKHASAANPGAKCLYHSEIVEGPQGTPQFKVTCADMSEHSYEDSTPNVRGIPDCIWEAAGRVRSCRLRQRRGPKNATQNTRCCNVQLHACVSYLASRNHLRNIPALRGFYFFGKDCNQRPGRWCPLFPICAVNLGNGALSDCFSCT